MDQVEGIEQKEVLEYMDQYFELGYEVTAKASIQNIENPFGNYKTILYNLFIYREKSNTKKEG